MLVREKRFEERLVIAFLLSFWVHIALFMPPHKNAHSTRLNFLKPNVVRGSSTVEVYLVKGSTPKKAVQPVAEQVKKTAPQIVNVPVKRSVTTIRPASQIVQNKAEGLSAYTQKKEIRPGNAPVNAIPNPRTDPGAISKEIASLLINQPPAYPTLARLKGWDGTVIVLVSVSSDGGVTKTEVTVSSGHSVLDESAITAVRKWRFKNVDTEMQVRVPIKFILTKE